MIWVMLGLVVVLFLLVFCIFAVLGQHTKAINDNTDALERLIVLNVPRRATPDELEDAARKGAFGTFMN